MPPESDVNNAPETQPQSETTPPEQLSTPPDTSTEPFKFGDDAPDFLKGKSPEETIDLVNNLVSVAQQLAANQQQAPAPQQQATMTQPTSQLPHEDLALTDPKEYQTQLTAYIRAQTQADLAQAAQPVFQQLGSMSREMSKNDPANKAVWSKWGHEVEQAVAAIPAHQRTKELYDQAITLVKGRHVDEIAAEKARSLAAASPNLASSSDDGTVSEPTGDSAVWEKIKNSPIGAATIAKVGRRGIMANIGPGRNQPYKTLEEYANAVAGSPAHVMKDGGEIVNKSLGVRHNVS